MKLTIIGTGYVGLVSGVCFSELGVHVTCIDNNQAKIDGLLKGDIPIYEPGLEAMVLRNSAADRLHFSTDLAAHVADANVVMIAVGTPPDKEDAGRADLSYVFATAEQVAQSLNGYTVVVTKSTVPVGTNAKVKAIISSANPKADFDVASNPEFLREGSAIEDFMTPDRIVVGVETDKASHLLSDLYQPLTNQGYTLLRTGIETAEMIKYASNSFLATKIAFINEMADICEKVGANVELVAKGMGMDTRIGDRFLNPGPGFGGSCFPKDATALARLAEDAGITPEIINKVIQTNLKRRANMAERVIAAAGGSVKGKRIAILGLSFKANTDDMRESPSLSIIPTLVEQGAEIIAYDPEAMENAKALLPSSIRYAETLEEATQDAALACIITEWQAFRDLDLKKLRARMAYPLIVDLRNLFTAETMRECGFDYYSIGRKPVLGTKEKVTQPQFAT